MIILAVDLGIKRTGLALCDKDEILAYPYKLICEANIDILAEKIFNEYKYTKSEKILIGLPKNMDGSEGDSAQKALNFGENLQKKYALEIDFCDERRTTVSAHEFLNQMKVRGKKRKSTVDMLSATIILQNYLNFRKCKLN